jgi:hypothetical protein
VVVRNVNVDNEWSVISNVTANTFDVTVSSSAGSSSGSSAAYSLAFTTGTVTSTSQTITAPAGGEVQLLGTLTATGSRAALATFAITVPASATNGGGADSKMADSFFPVFQAKNQNTGAQRTGVVMTLVTSVPFNIYTVTGIGSDTDGALIRMTFS